MSYIKYFLLLIIFSCTNNINVRKDIKKPNASITKKSSKSAVVTAHPLATKIASEILKKGGNAFDAMIATHFALAVVYPSAGDLGGGGFMVFRDKNGNNGSLDFREQAPLKAHKDMYLDKNKNIIKNLSSEGALSVGVPGTVDGLFKIHKKFATIAMKDLIAPAIKIALDGYELTKKEADKLNQYQEQLRKYNGLDTIFTNNIIWEEGMTVKRLALAQTLKRIASNGRDEFYKGETAKYIVDTLKEKNGIITSKDLAIYSSKWRDTVKGNYKNYNIISMGPPSSGGICLIQILKMIEKFPLKTYVFQKLKTIQVMVEAERRAFADRAHYLGDPDFVKIPMKTLLDKNYLKKRMSDFSFRKATNSKNINYGKIAKESFETTHFSIVDKYGNAVSTTITLNSNFGSKIFVKEAGIFLNNEMDDFSSKPGHPNIYGLVGAKANAIAPKKRMLSSMTPTIIEKDNKLFMVVGSPGGPTIITSVLQTFLNVVEFDMTMQQAVSKGRFHHQYLPDRILVEKNIFNKKLQQDLKTKGYVIKEFRKYGRVAAILIDDNKLEIGADPRGDDKAMIVE